MTAERPRDFVHVHFTRKSVFWDAMIVHAASESGCDVLWTEDLSDGQLLRGFGYGTPLPKSTRGRGTLTQRLVIAPPAETCHETPNETLVEKLFRVFVRFVASFCLFLG